MKKIYALIILSFSFLSASAVIHNVNVSSNTFTPSSLNVTVGDTVRWILVSGVHTSTSTSVPSGALGWDSGTMSSVGQNFSYKVTTAGTYNYQCLFHPGMVGSFIALSPSSVQSSAFVSFLPAYPNPFTESVTVPVGGGADEILILDIIGEKVASFNVEGSSDQVFLNLKDLPGGVYFYQVRKEDAILHVRRLIKK